MEDYLTFRKMLTPVAIQVIFWIGALACVVLGLVMIVTGASTHYGGGGQVLSGVLTLLLGPIMVRISCEVLIVVFRILDTLVEIRDKLQS
ncbi:MAG TPA: DUF4282 domain-containing protein [Candidatus Bipolaricaulis anaerobius]|uniref:DUF4282 domain-containing protein n=1 Tax=Candidatus Bipolaricaulis anaerobius TaxID=2026885 RepID=A0A2X3MJI1_9BACT|nr:DUF4282 domain-containing protein [Candidatus Bipolaricaulis anaerobius]MBP7726281.1 DUF4282 domain-containing protein [Candidatus Bipolaricaulis sp.]MDD3748272.1 DUF4282 domain-containing protein [Candidatus Bipolaricaulis anaerobius]MDD5764009.1 DUF4282 domain-containing protein [Candidatus Bipolaricaulis anaerobius]SQD92285.1 conserved protein of unknown function [Candidatus Bipolaricaulis anaerobius]HNR24954.1 DUF4282 domain-containing protein [Candidatus Bipolaricaulis anaerobius]